MIEMFQLICHSRNIALQQGCYFNLHLWIFRRLFSAKLPAKCRDVQQAGSRWKENPLTRAAEEEDYRVCPTYLFFIIMNNLQFKEKIHLSYFTPSSEILYVREVKFRLSRVLRNL